VSAGDPVLLVNKSQTKQRAEWLTGRLGLWSHLFNCRAFIHAAGACGMPCSAFPRHFPLFNSQRTHIFFHYFEGGGLVGVLKKYLNIIK